MGVYKIIYLFIASCFNKKTQGWIGIIGNKNIFFFFVYPLGNKKSWDGCLESKKKHIDGNTSWVAALIPSIGHSHFFWVYVLKRRLEELILYGKKENKWLFGSLSHWVFDFYCNNMNFLFFDYIWYLFLMIITLQ